MKLFIDIGNSRLKWCFSDTDENTVYGATAYQDSTFEQTLDKHWLAQPEPTDIIVCTVCGPDIRETLCAWCDRTWRIQPRFASVEKHCGDVVNAYDDVSQLGVDRWIAIIAARNLCHKNILVVDCGTAMTLDGIEANGQHRGGLIVPGVDMMLNSLPEKTREINSLKSRQDLNDSLFGRSTDECLLKGSLISTSALIEQSHQLFQTELQSEVECLITGGAAPEVMTKLSIKYEHYPHLVLQGLGVWVQNS